MLMNKIEFFAMNNPLRAVIQEIIEVKTLQRLSQLTTGKIVLEIGCGNGTGAKLIKKYFHPKSITAIDLDERMIRIAKRKNSDPSVLFEVADAASLPYKNNIFDAVFDFGIIHHISNWRDCIKELHRVMKSKGELLIEDLSIETFTSGVGKPLRRILAHPYKTMYTRKDFFRYLQEVGFTMQTKKLYAPLGFQYFIVIARK